MKIINNQIEIINKKDGNYSDICVVIQGQWKDHPAGDYEITEGDVIQMVENFNAEGRDLLFDYDHESLYGGKSIAAGWGKEIYVKNGEIHAKVEWTPKALEAIKNKEYRYLSNVLIFNYSDKNNASVRGTYLHSVALTNVPFQKDLPSIMNKMYQNIKKEDDMDEILKALGVKTEAEAIAKINSMTQIANSVNESTTILNQMKTENTTLKDKVKELNTTIVNNEIDLAIAGGKLLPKYRETAILLRNTDKTQYENFLKTTEKIPGQMQIPNNQHHGGGNEEDWNEFIPGGEK